VATLFVLLLGIAFIAMSDVVLRLMFGAPPQGGILPPREKFWTVAAPFGLAVLVLILGLYVPPILSTHLKDAARLFGG
jgi:formate hydrogenlyase subunit 3/multisubunit Na+/H+ antiporter MnhD subunit